MPKIFIPPQMRDLTAGQTEVVIDAETLRQVIAGLEQQFPGIAERLQEDDRIVSGLAVAIDGMVTSRGLLARVKPESEIHFLPAIGGG